MFCHMDTVLILVCSCLQSVYIVSCCFQAVKNLMSISLILLLLIVLPAYLIWNAIKRHSDVDDSIMSATLGISDPPIEDVSTDSDCDEDCSAVMQIIKGPNGLALKKAYEKMMSMFILKENGECKNAGFTGVLNDSDRAKRLAKIDDDIVFPAFSEHPAAYRSWWMKFYNDVYMNMLKGPNVAQRNICAAVFEDVRKGDCILLNYNIFDYMQDDVSEVDELFEDDDYDKSKKKRI